MAPNTWAAWAPASAVLAPMVWPLCTAPSTGPLPQTDMRRWWPYSSRHNGAHMGTLARMLAIFPGRLTTQPARGAHGRRILATALITSLLFCCLVGMIETRTGTNRNSRASPTAQPCCRGLPFTSGPVPCWPDGFQPGWPGQAGFGG